jgi:hypothetical protein
MLDVVVEGESPLDVIIDDTLVDDATATLVLPLEAEHSQAPSTRRLLAKP